LHAADLGPIYRWQKRFLQHLQLGHPNKRWVLKSPDHVYSIDKLLTVFPDAAIIQVHRNPLEVVRSQIRLTKVLEGMYARPRGSLQLAISETRKIEQMLERITHFRDAIPTRPNIFIDVTYRELTSSPLAVVRRIYERLEIRLTEAAIERMSSLASARSRYDRRSVDPPGLTDLPLEADFRCYDDYCSRFGVLLMDATG
jgi:hypothetical protein